ncbi:MAG: DUF4833 domain-containing protein [Flavobacteriales bacterium]|jgi:hypothetical protein|nr:DUF4833 domain-containing protein [Flavobacteriales bacterium]
MQKKFKITYLFLFLIMTSFIFNDDNYQNRIKVFEGYPIPKDDKMLFYIQKSYNTNTVVYAANINSKGKLDSKEPVIVFWRRYQEGGHKRELKAVEKTFGYGVKAKPLKDRENTYIFSLVSLKDMNFVITQDKNGHPEVATIINNKPARIEKVFVTAEHVSILPKIFAVEVFGKDIKTGKPLYEKIVNKEE